MSVASRIEEIQEHLTDDYDVLELAGADLTNVDKNIINLKPTWQERLLYFINNGTDEVWNNWEKVTGENTELSLENTIQAPMKIDLKGNTYQKSTTGKNLFDVPSVYSFEGSKSKNITLPAGTYYINCGNITKGGENDPYIVITGVGGIALTQNLNRRFTLSSEITSVSFYSNGWDWNASQGITSTAENLMISTSGGDYEPYTNGASPNPDYPQDIQVVSGDNTIEVVGKNLLKSASSWTNIGDYLSTHTVTNNTIYVENTNANKYAGCNVNVFSVKENKTYTVSMKATKSTSNSPQIRLGKNNNNVSNIIGTGDIIEETDHYKITKTFTSTESFNLNIHFYPNYDGTDITSVTFYDIQLEEGNTPTAYTLHQEENYPINLGNTELCKIGDYQDKIYKQDGKWYLHKEIGKVVLDGSESWSAYTNTDSQGNTYGYFIPLSQQPLQETHATNFALSNQFLQQRRDAVSIVDTQGIYLGSGKTMFIKIAQNLISGGTIANFKTWLSTHNTIVYYVLATPTTTEITDTTLLSQLETVKKSYDTQTNISQDNDDLPFILDVTALKNI